MDTRQAGRSKNRNRIHHKVRNLSLQKVVRHQVVTQKGKGKGSKGHKGLTRGYRRTGHKRRTGRKGRKEKTVIQRLILMIDVVFIINYVMFWKTLIMYFEMVWLL
uniref:Uncharacterized protein n=1 Tax=Lactuca sativa TaxID=4236 RepID=A0A9R1UUM2_LACSA|nr:hypothetical protein LSAT_V11C800427390 [Lactuca sativa]